jgi:transcription initiation factor TFIIB
MTGESPPVRTSERTRTDTRTPDAGPTRRVDTDSQEQEDERSRDTCPECGGDVHADDQRGDRACKECGLVVEADEVDRGPEWRAYNSSEKRSKSRVGAPEKQTLHDKGLSSVISWENRDAYGNALSAKKRQQMQRLRTWDERFRSQSAKDRNLKQALGEVSRMAAALGLPDDVAETASVIYRRALDEDLLPGRSIEAMTTAALYAAARMSNMPRSLDEFAPVSRVEQQEFARAYRYTAKELGLAVEPADPKQYVPRIASDLDLPDSVASQAERLLEAGRDKGIYSGKSPVGLAAAAIYAASVLENDRVTQRTVGEAANVCAVTIRNRYRELLDAAEA